MLLGQGSRDLRSVSERDAVQLAFDSFGRNQRYHKKSGSWYCSLEDVVQVLDLQRSQYGPVYYVNIALWLLAIEPADQPKEWNCHIRTRLSQLLIHREKEIGELLDLSVDMSSTDRQARLIDILETDTLPLLFACRTIEGLRSEPGMTFLSRSLINGAAQRVLGIPG